jgi:signal transduction histidine kinase
MNLSNGAAIALGAVALLAALAAGIWLRLKTTPFRPGPMPAGSSGHALSPIRAAVDPFRQGSDPDFEILRPEQVAAIYRQTGFNLAINFANVAVLAVVLAGKVNSAALALWCAAVLLVAGTGLWRWAGNRNRPVPDRVSKRTLRRMTYRAAVLASLWGGGFALFYGDAGTAGQLVLVALGMGMTSGGMLALAPAPGAAAAFASCVLVPGILRLVTTGSSGDLALAALCTMYACSMAATLAEVYDTFARNVLARRAQQDQAATIALLLNTYEEHASAWLWESDRDGLLLGSPARMEELLDVPHGTLIGRPIWAPGSAAGRLAEESNDLKEDVRIGRPFRDRVVSARRAGDGAVISLSLSGRRFADERWHGVGSDVTAREEAQRTLTAAMEAAAAGAQSKSQFLATMSHELRTPLNAILGFTELLTAGIGGQLSDRQRGYLADIHRSGGYLLSLINDVLDMSQADAGRLVLTEEVVDLSALAAAAVRLVAPQAATAGVQIELAIDPDLPRLRVDGRRLTQVLVNLLSNSVKFTPSGGRIDVAAGLRADGALVLSVADTGIGMAASDIPKALERFGQVDSRFEGTGLGLPVAKQLVELHGGTLAIESAIEKGTRVTITLPTSRVVLSPDAEHREPTPGAV